MGPLLCLLSAVGFGLMAVFAKAAYGDGVSVQALLLVRFAMAAAVLLAVAAGTGALRRLTPRAVAVGLAMGVFGYAVQSTFYFSALQHLDASLVALVFYVYPATVMVAAIAIGRESPSRRRLGALGVALAGTVLVLAGAATGQFDVLGVLLALGAAGTYTCYILVGDRVTGGIPPVALSGLVCAGAAAAFLVAGAARGGTDLGFEPRAWIWLTAIALVGTVGGVLMFFAGLARVGPSTAAILSAVEPVTTVGSAALVFGEVLTPAQLAGGALVLAAVVLVQLRPPEVEEAGHAPEVEEAGHGPLVEEAGHGRLETPGPALPLVEEAGHGRLETPGPALLT
ncbi:MAG TPA: DMT family transporter [Nocardioides sp.]|nr:DMT family transporter [Nocardioides sp.]